MNERAGNQVHQRGDELPRQHDRRLVPPPPPSLPLVQLARAVQRDQHRKRPRAAAGEGEPHVDRQDDPAVSPEPDRVSVARAARVAVATLAVDVFAPVLRGRVVDRALRRFVRGGTSSNTIAASTRPSGHKDQRAREKKRW
jgi:hypothetical protein